jgi:hypothetical protein
MSILARPGINPIWAKTVKSDYSPRQVGMSNDTVDLGRTKIERYCLHDELGSVDVLPRW